VDPEALARRSDELVERDDWGPDALATNRELVERDPSATRARFRLALCFEEAGEVLAAREAFARVLARETDGLEARVAARHLAILEERARAVATPSPYEALARARKHARNGELDRAHVWYDRALETAERPSEHAQALTGRASVLRTERRFGEALTAAEQSIAAHPSRGANMPAYACLTAIFADLGRLDTARCEADALLAEHPNDPIANATAGRVYRALAKRTDDDELRRKAGRCFARARHAR
jgi:tetratricopeptide (TPR) repeat protein